MTVLLAIMMVVALGTWIPLTQLWPQTPERTRIFYVAVGNVVLAGVALLASGGGLQVGWRTFWLPLLGGLVWAAGNYCVLRAARLIGLARAAGTWTPLNIVVAFVWGALLFGELDGFSALGLVVLVVAFLAVVAGVLLIAGAREEPAPDGGQPAEPAELAEPAAPVRAGARGAGFLWAGAAGVLWGSYFIPAQWADVPAQVSNVPLALGILVGSLALSLPAREPVRLGLRPTGGLLTAGLLFGLGNLALLGLVSRVGTGTGFTVAQLSLAVNAGIGIWFFHAPQPGTSQARTVLTGIVVAGLGGGAIAAMR
jgi:glucose uptake protein GlcU